MTTGKSVTILHQNISLRWINSFSSQCWLVGRNNQSDNEVSRRMIFSRENKFQKNKRWRHHDVIGKWFLSAGPGESSAACYWVVNINLNLLSWHVVTFWWIFRMTFLKIQFSKNIFEIIRPRNSDPNSTVWYTTYNEIEFISCVSAAFIPNLLP